MSPTLEFAVRALAIGLGATLAGDLYALALKWFFGLPSLNYAMVGRWVGHFPRGRFVHAGIAQASPVRGETTLGWTLHYVIGVIFAAILLAVAGLAWARQPTPGPALAVGIATVAMPFFVMQPAFGLGIAASNTPRPNVARLRSLANHAVFGAGLYAAAWATAALWR